LDLDDNLLPREGENPHAAIVRQAHSDFRKARKWNAEAYERWNMDYKFANGDAYNNYQWPDAIYETRGNRPTLTVNLTRQHCKLISNEARQNKASVKYRPVGNEATEAAAEVMEGIYRHIANISNAQMVQGVAIDYQVQAGLGFTRVMADYASDDSFDQEIYIRLVPNPMSCYLDPDHREPDGSDARYAFIFADRPRDEVETAYPQLKGRLAASNAVDDEDSGWIRDDHIREAEYYKVVETKDELIGDQDGTTILRSEAPAKLIKKWEQQAEEEGYELRTRDVVKRGVKWYKIVGDQVVEETDVPGTTVPIVPWVGEQTIIDQRIDRKGHTRALIGAQQMANYNWSASVEFGALQSKTPYIGAAKAIEGYETYWNAANTENFSILVFNDLDDDGKDHAPPQRQQPPTGAPIYLEGVQVAEKFMQSASGQYQAELGAPGNEKSGKAINERQRQADRATYHFVDNQALAIRRQGSIVQEWIREIYDTKRVLRIIGEDGDESQVQLDPEAAQAHQKSVNGALAVFNPNVGRYEVVSDVGPDYATQRQEAFNAIVQILTQAPALIDRIGDLLFKVADFPLADQIAERLKPGLPPQAQAAIANLQQQLAKQNKLLGEAMQSLTEERLKVKAKDSSSVVDEFKADTDRAKMLLDAASKVDPTLAMEMIREMASAAVRQALQDNLGPVRTAAAPDLDTDSTAQPLPGATGALPTQDVAAGNGPATPGGL
jgi:Phage P22-like portal protein